MNLKDVKLKVLRLIEEVDTDEKNLTKDPDIAEKLNEVINHIQYELSRLKKIPRYTEIEVTEGDMISFNDIKEATGDTVYELDIVRGAEYEYKAHGTIIKALENGTLEIEYFKYPERITKKTTDEYVFELDDDVLELLTIGVAGDILKSDVANAYGNIYSQRYESMKQQLDTRHNLGSIEFSGGVE